jgi:hypothetical protein
MTIRFCILSAALTALASPAHAGAQDLSVADPTQDARTTDAGVPGGTTSSPFENIELFAGLDGSKQPQDLGINANMGVRFAVNTGVPISRRAGLGLQVGLAVNLSDSAVHVLDQIEGTSKRTQTFLTVALFQQPPSGFSWALGVDALHERYYDTFNLGQMRAQAGYIVSSSDEVGALFTKSVRSDQGAVGSTRVQLSPITQIHGYFRHSWPAQARTTVWAGVATHHHSVVLVFPDDTRRKNVVVYGARLEMPLSTRVSVTGSGNFITPTATGTVDAYLGLTYYLRRQPKVGRGRFAPPMTVGNNPEFPVDLHR